MDAKALALIFVGIVLVVVGVIYGFLLAVPNLADGDTFEYLVTYTENDSVVDTSTFTLTVDGEEEIGGVACYHIDVSIDPQAVRMTTLGGNSTVLGSEMWVSKDTLDLVRERPVALNEHEVYGVVQVTTTLDYTYGCGHGWPWKVGKAWSSEIVVSADPDPGYTMPPINRSVMIGDIEEVTVPAGTFSCYRIEQSDPDTDEIALVEWWSNDMNMFVKMVDYGNYAGTETRELQGYPGSE